MLPSLRFRLVATLAAFAAWALVAVGGVVRVTESGLGCPDWPTCSGRVVPLEQKAPIIEYSHRATAGLVTVLVFITALWAWRVYRRRRDVLLPALAAAVLVPFQALLGAIVVWLELPGWIVAVHFVVGIVFMGAAVATAARAWWRPAAASPAFTRLAWSGALLALVVVSIGTAVVAAAADNACGQEWPTCNGTFVAGGNLAALQVVHRTLAYVVAAFALALALLAWRRRGPVAAGLLPLLAVAAQVSFGVGVVLTRDGTTARDAFEMLHVAGAGAVFASFVAVSAFLLAPVRTGLLRADAVPARA